MGKKKNGLPDRWLAYKSMGSRIPGTRFICFKVPLKQSFERHGSDFSVRDLCDHCSDLGLVIDLTNTDRYYSPKELEECGVDYQKIYTEGHVVPSDSVFREFADTVTTFLNRNRNNGKLVGVHCTHGVNRTGYLVCRYMIQLLDNSPDQAINDFNSSRGHEIERTNYIEDLRQAKWIKDDPSGYIPYCVSVAGRGRGRHSRGGKRKREEITDPFYDYGNNYDEVHPTDPPNESRRDSWSNIDQIYFGYSGNNRRRSDLHQTWTVSDYNTDDNNHFNTSSNSPRGTKRNYMEASGSDNTAADDGMSSHSSRAKKAHYDPMYDYGDQRFDPYYYQDTKSVGPDRNYGLLVPTGIGETRQYAGPRRARNYGRQTSNQEPEFSDSLFPNHQPLQMPEGDNTITEKLVPGLFNFEPALVSAENRGSTTSLYKEPESPPPNEEEYFKIGMAVLARKDNMENFKAGERRRQKELKKAKKKEEKEEKGGGLLNLITSKLLPSFLRKSKDTKKSSEVQEPASIQKAPVPDENENTTSQPEATEQKKDGTSVESKDTDTTKTKTGENENTKLRANKRKSIESKSGKDHVETKSVGTPGSKRIKTTDDNLTKRSESKTPVVTKKNESETTGGNVTKRNESKNTGDNVTKKKESKITGDNVTKKSESKNTSEKVTKKTEPKTPVVTNPSGSKVKKSLEAVDGTPRSDVTTPSKKKKPAGQRRRSSNRFEPY